MAHSKRNTSRAVFTSYERTIARAAWGASSARLSRESFLPFASCSLCLEAAIDPVACPLGDIFCRECALSNILAQKQEIKRAARQRDREERESRELHALAEAEAQDRAVREFELIQAGLDVAPNPKSKGGDGRRAPSISAETSTFTKGGDRDRPQLPPPPLLQSSSSSGDGGGTAGTTAADSKKRKFELDDEELARIAAEDRAKARQRLDHEKKVAAQPALPSFWAPTVAPSSNRNDVLHEVKKEVKTQPVCPSSQEHSPHHYSMHELVSVNFAEDGGEAGGTTRQQRQRICPSCKKGLTNSSKAMLAKPCGHVLCGSCVKQFMTADAANGGLVLCFVCDADLTDRRDTDDKHGGKGGKEKDKGKGKIRPGLVQLRSEGTGFSASGANQVKKDGVAFQC